MYFIPYIVDAFEVSADNVGELKAAIQKQFNEDVSGWNIFHLGLLLPQDDNVKIEEIALDDEQLVLSLALPPPEPEATKLRMVSTDKTRFVFRGTRASFEILELHPDRPLPTKLKRSGWIKRLETIGIITNSSGEEGKRKVQVLKYQVPSGDGNIDLKSDKDTGLDKVFLVQEDPPKTVELVPVDTKSYDEEKVTSPFELKKLKIKYVDALFSGMGAGNSTSNVYFN